MDDGTETVLVRSGELVFDLEGKLTVPILEGDHRNAAKCQRPRDRVYNDAVACSQIGVSPRIGGLT